jgi:hypothetical protein
MSVLSVVLSTLKVKCGNALASLSAVKSARTKIDSLKPSL